MDIIKKEVITTGVRDVDERMGGGIPLGSLALIEGHSDAGKSVLTQHLTYGAMTVTQTSVAYYSTENSIKSLILQMDSLSLSVIDYFLMDRLRVYPLSLRSDLRDTEKPLNMLVTHFSLLPEHIKVVIVDSMTLLVAHSSPVSIIDFFSACKNLCDKGRSIILIAHSYSFDEEVLSRTRSLCDVHVKLRLEQVGERMIKIMEVLKVRGADRPTGEVVSFEIEPKLGMRIIPLSKARV